MLLTQIIKISQYLFSIVGLHADQLENLSQRLKNILLLCQRLSAK